MDMTPPDFLEEKVLLVLLLVLVGLLLLETEADDMLEKF